MKHRYMCPRCWMLYDMPGVCDWHAEDELDCEPVTILAGHLSRNGLKSIIQILNVELDAMTDHYEESHPIWDTVDQLEREARDEIRDLDD